MARKVGWTRTDVTSGRGGPDKERKYRGKKGEKHYVRVMTECEEYRVHAVNDVLDPDDNGEERVFNMTCSKEWDEKEEEWVGECRGCDRDYDLSEKFLSGLLLLGVVKGRRGKLQKIDPENAVHWWPFGADKYRKISDIAIELEEAGKSLRQVELVITCEDDNFQKLNIQVSQQKRLTTKAHVLAWNEEGPDLLDEAAKAPTLKEQDRNLRRKKKSRGSRNDDDSGERPAKRSSGGKKRRSRDDDEPEDDMDSTEEEGLDDLLDEL